MGNKRYWNKLRCKEKKVPNLHKVYSISIPEHIIKKTDWKKDDLIGFQLYKGYSKARFSIELRNLSKEKEPYASLTFLQVEEQHKDFLKKITTRNLGNFSKDMQEIFIKQKRNKIKKKEKENLRKAKESKKKLKEMAIMALKKEIQDKKETNKKRIQQYREGNKRRIYYVKSYNKHNLITLKKFLEDDLKERENKLKKLLKKPKKCPITPKPTKNDSK